MMRSMAGLGVGLRVLAAAIAIAQIGCDREPAASAPVPPPESASVQATHQDNVVAAEVPEVPESLKPVVREFALTFNDLKFEMDKDEPFSRTMLTEKINQYHGGKVTLRGYIRPNFKQTGITKFIFVRDNKECCFGPQAAIFDNVLVRLAENQSVDYTVRPVAVQGNFVLKEYEGPDGKVWSLYRMYDAQVLN